ncbi:MAG: NADAR family protein [Halobacteriovoraceae bacterium]|jgi:predicted NAD-dependent protein-ADP-ribosyltransferase YbiA (DUF1768 family)|nr:NADAR family protein [Halobacteriovoraceae bacterium]MBT5092592.1 NADAR family protein [Halobacteriovoraceae bacterium]
MKLYYYLFFILVPSLLLAADKGHQDSWWAPFPPDQARSWEVLPQEAERSQAEVILSKRTELGIFSNLPKAKFNLDGRRYYSVEALWQMMKYPDLNDPTDPRHAIHSWPYTRDQVRKLSGFQSKKAGDAANKLMRAHGINFVSYQGQRFDYKDGASGSASHYKIIRRAMVAKLNQNRKIKKLLIQTRGLTLRPDHQVRATKPASYHYYKIWMELRDHLNADDVAGLTNKDTLTLYFFHSPSGVNWKSPKELARSILKNTVTFKDRSIGHVAVELKCQLPEGNVDVLTGMTSSDNTDRRLLFKEKVGFGVVFADLPGKMENSEDLRKEITKKLKTKKLKKQRMNFLTHQISKTTCRRLKLYLKQFKERELYRHYGLPNRPLYGEGGGCSAFGVSFLEAAGLLTEEEKRAWSYNIRFPLKWIGGKYNPEAPEQRISFWNIYFVKKKDNFWAKQDEPHKNIYFWDPDTIFNWVQHKVANYSPYEKYQLFKRKNVWGLFYDSRKTETPAGPIWRD